MMLTNKRRVLPGPIKLGTLDASTGFSKVFKLPSSATPGNYSLVAEETAGYANVEGDVSLFG
jgi:hypothetical protein